MDDPARSRSAAIDPAEIVDGSLYARVASGENRTPLLDKLATLSDEEWSELTHRVAKHFRRELHARGYIIVRSSDDG